MNYLQKISTAIQQEVPSEALPKDNVDDLFQIYALLLLAKGENVSSEDVHNAWAVWKLIKGEGHEALIPFEELSEGTQKEDQVFVQAIRRVAKRRTHVVGPLMKEVGHVFISYSRRGDADFVRQLSEDLRAAGFTPWVDVEQISPGQNWEQVLERSIKEAAAVIYVSSRNSVESSWMSRELAGVLNASGNLLPVVRDDVGANRLPDPLQRIQWADFRTNYDDGLRSLLSALTAIVEPGEPRGSAPRKSKGYVFLSYAEEDRQFVQELNSFLREQKPGYWDYDESDRDYHGQMFSELEGIIREATATLSILTPAWKLSKWTIREYVFSEEVGTPVFLLKVEEMGPTLVIAGIPYIDFTKGAEQGLQRLHRELQRKGL